MKLSKNTQKELFSPNTLLALIFVIKEKKKEQTDILKSPLMVSIQPVILKHECPYPVPSNTEIQSL